MDLKEMFERIKKGEVAAHSELGTRDEAKQVKNFTARIQQLRLKTNIKAHVLVMKDVTIPFNPFTCEVDDVYNTKTPFRPILLVSQTLQQIKDICKENPELAAKWNEKLGKEIKWDEPVTMDDYFAFKSRGMIMPRIMSYSTVAINFGGRLGFSNYRTLYTVDPSQLDESNNYKPGVNPLWHQAAVFFFSMLTPEINEVVGAMEKQSASKEQISNQKAAIRAKSPVSFVSQTNLIPIIYLPLDEMPKNYDPHTPIDFESSLRWIKKNNDKWSAAFEDLKNNNAYDDIMDYYDLTIRTPSSQERKSNGQVFTDDDGIELYKAMTINVTDSRVGVHSGQSTIDGRIIRNQELYAPVFEAAKRYFEFSQGESMRDGGDTFEKIMAASSRYRPIESIMEKFLQACNQVYLDQFADSKYCTEERKMANAEFFLAMSPDNAMALASADDEDIEAAGEKQAKSLKDILKAARDGADDDAEDSDEMATDLPLS